MSIMDAKTLRETLAGAKLVALDEDSAESFYFHDDLAGVAATLGTRSGGVCAPVLRCQVTDDARVQFSDSRSVIFTWEQVELSDGVLTASCGQHLKRFTFTPVKKRERYLP
jgi:hypothetical protein